MQASPLNEFVELDFEPRVGFGGASVQRVADQRRAAAIPRLESSVTDNECRVPSPPVCERRSRDVPAKLRGQTDDVGIRGCRYVGGNGRGGDERERRRGGERQQAMEPAFHLVQIRIFARPNKTNAARVRKRVTTLHIGPSAFDAT
jgi:hypothetical protein